MSKKKKESEPEKEKTRSVAERASGVRGVFQLVATATSKTVIIIIIVKTSTVPRAVIQ